MASSQFERQVIDGTSSTSEPSMSKGRSGGPRQYAISPSFLDHDPPQTRTDELPAWLQTFIATVGDPSESGAPALSSQHPPENSNIELDSRGEEYPGSEASGNSTPDPDPTDSATSDRRNDFISEDDLPDWLRAIGPADSGSQPEHSPAPNPRGGDGNMQVPNVARAWASARDDQSRDERASLFATIANQTPRTSIPDQDEGHEHQSASGTEDESIIAGPSRSRSARGSIDIAASVDVVQDDNQQSVTSSPIMPLVIAGLVLLVLVSAVVLLFVL